VRIVPASNSDGRLQLRVASFECDKIGVALIVNVNPRIKDFYCVRGSIQDGERIHQIGAQKWIDVFHFVISVT
jgi:hypothetical protein